MPATGNSLDSSQGFRYELRDFLRFIRHPAPNPRVRRRFSVPTNGFVADWLCTPRWRRLLQWAGFLWAVNLVLLGPIAVAAATAAGAEHRLDVQAIPWLQALVWAPLIEELVFRYGLRRPGKAWWLVPAAAVIMFSGPVLTAQLSLMALLLICWWPAVRTDGAGRPGVPAAVFRRRRHAVRHYGWLFHGSSLAFAAIHLHNFTFGQTAWWLLPLLVLPQWVTGMVLGWLRIRHGIGAAIRLHALFNAGPLILVWMLVGLL